MRNFHALPLAFFAFAVAAQPQPERGQANLQTIDQLKIAYLECDRRASASILDFEDATTCSRVHEELKRRGFGNDWTRMLAWWNAEKVASERGRRRETDVSLRETPAPLVKLR